MARAHLPVNVRVFFLFNRASLVARHGLAFLDGAAENRYRFLHALAARLDDANNVIAGLRLAKNGHILRHLEWLIQG